MSKSTTNLIPIEPSILVWARETIGLTIEEVALKLKKKTEVIESWEQGIEIPTFPQLEKLAYEIYKRPLAAFFLKEPPEESEPSQDFRTLSSAEIKELSPQTRLMIRKAKFNQLSLKELCDGVNPSENPIHKRLKLTASDNPILAAKKVRKFLNITPLLQFDQKDSRIVFNNLRQLVEDAGVFVFQFTLREVRGFSLMDEEFPIIGIRGSDTYNGKIFTLFHELCHILFNVGGVFRGLESGNLNQDYAAIEQFCNQFAAELLVPSGLFKTEYFIKNNGYQENWDESQLAALSNKYKVSKEVILRRILDMNLTSKKSYQMKRKAWNNFYDQAQQKKANGGSGNFYNTKISQLGKSYIDLAMEKHSQGKISTRELSEYLGVKINQLPIINEKIN